MEKFRVLFSSFVGMVAGIAVDALGVSYQHDTVLFFVLVIGIVIAANLIFSSQE